MARPRKNQVCMCRECQHAKVVEYDQEKSGRYVGNRLVRVCSVVDSEVNTRKPVACEFFDTKAIITRMKHAASAGI